jgi:hypothetical protein
MQGGELLTRYGSNAPRSAAGSDGPELGHDATG